MSSTNLFYRDLRKYPCFCGFEWCTLKIFIFYFILFLFLSYAFLASLGSLEPIPFKELNLVHFIHPLLGFHTHLRLFLFVPLVGSCLQFAPFARTCYGLYLLLVRATACTRYWYVLRVVPITGICLQSVPIIGMCYGLYLLLLPAIACTHYWYVLWVIPIAGTCYKLYPLLGYAYNLHSLLLHATGCIHC